MQHSIKLARLMRLSWEIQNKKSHYLKQKQKRAKGRRSIRSLALEAAWSIMQNEEITVYYLVKRYSHDKYPNKVQTNNISLFQTQ